MAEKRKLPARERREPVAKRRASEITPQTPTRPAPSSSRKKSTPGGAPAAAVSEPVADATPLPIKIKDGEGLPTTAIPQQTALLSDKDYQSIAESAVLLTSLERSKKKWLSDGILVRYWTKPKKTKREQIESRNPPKDTMIKVGPCNIMIGPHLFDAMLYTVKDPNAPPPIQYTPPQRPMVHYGHPNNFQQYQPYPPPPPLSMPPQQLQPVRSQVAPSPGPPQPGYQRNNQQPMRPPSQQGRPPSQASPNPPPPPPGPQQRPSPSQPTPQPAKPSPDPVIQMLATRAASDPELKALMRVVASTEATQEQLRAFQAHIDELNAIIRAREQRQQQQQTQQSAPAPLPPQNPPQQLLEQPSTPKQQSKPQQMARVEVQMPQRSSSGNPPSQSPNQKPASQPQTPMPPNTGATPPVKQEPTATPQPTAPSLGPNAAITPAPPASTPQQPNPAVRPMPPPPQSAGPHPGRSPYPTYQPPPIHSRPPQYGSPTPYYRPAPPPPPQRQNYKSVVFEFTSPLTPYGSSTSGHAGSGDRYLFPENTILEWLPGGTTVLASFLVVRQVDPNLPFPIETESELANSKTKGKSASKSKKKKAADQPPGTPASDAKYAATTEGGNPSNASQDQQPSTPSEQATEPKKETPTLKEYWQPVTFRIHSPNPKVLEPLSRVVKPADEVRKYMNEVMDRADRAPDGFLAMRLPRSEAQAEREKENTATDAGAAGTPGTRTGRRQSSRAKGAVAIAEQEDTVMVDSENNEGVEEEEEEEELKEFYGAPTGLTSW